MKLTEENYVETAEKAIKEICGKKRSEGENCCSGYNFKNPKSFGNDSSYLQ